MASPDADDELLSVLLVNLRNAAATFGEGTPPYESIRTTVEEHLQAMKAKKNGTNITGVRHASSSSDTVAKAASSSQATTLSFANLAYRPKPRKE